MKYGAVLAMILLTMVVASACAGQPPRQSLSVDDKMAVQVTLINVTSPAFDQGDRIPVKYTADGVDMSPPLNWPHVREVSKWALICEDPDAPSGTFTHWVMYNIPGSYTGLPDGVTQQEELSDGSMQGRNSFGKIGYNGPAPPPGKPHHYNFRVYGLDAHLDLPPGITKNELETAMKGHVIAEGTLTGLYGR